MKQIVRLTSVESNHPVKDFDSESYTYVSTIYEVGWGVPVKRKGNETWYSDVTEISEWDDNRFFVRLENGSYLTVPKASFVALYQEVEEND